MIVRHLPVALGIVLLTAIGFFWFPGHTILQSDTQIYIPMLEHLANPAVLSNDIMAVRPHMAFTLFDEVVLPLHRITGLGFEVLLSAQQFLYRALGVLGLYLLGTGIGLSRTHAFVMAALVSLGAAIMGPAVLTVEYEPVPRAFALPFVWLSIGCLLHNRWLLAAASASIGFAFHPPTLLVFWALLFLILLRNRRFLDISVLSAGPVLLTLTLLIEPSSADRAELFGTIDPALEQLQRMRASYNWVSIWLPEWGGHYLLVTATFAAAYWRVREMLPGVLKLIILTLVTAGIISVPASYLFLEKMKWLLLPQFQPGRYLLFLTFFAVLLSAIAAIRAAGAKRWLETVLFAAVPIAVPIENNLLHLVTPSNALLWQRLAVTAVGAVFLALALRHKITAVAAALLCFYVLPWAGHVRNFAPLHTEPLHELSMWAKRQTPQDATFQFANFGRRLEPGVFRARAQRALYADWKAGGQANFMKSLADVWWERWQIIGRPQPLDTFRTLPIDYVAYELRSAPADAVPIYRNAGYVVYKLR